MQRWLRNAAHSARRRVGVGQGRPSERICYVHIGTHKAGSTAIQQFLHAHARALAARGIFVPTSGRLADTPDGCGHHCLAWDLLGSDPSSPISGIVESLIAEIHAQSLPIVCVSSEELEHLHVAPNNLARLSAGLAGIGYRTKIVVYLRPQADYLEALYAEVTRHAAVRDFWSCYREMLKHGCVDMWPDNRFTAMFDYERLIAPFAAIVGKRNIIVRAFRRNRRPQALLADFLGVLEGCGSDLTATIGQTGHVNSRLMFATVIRAIAANRADPAQRSLVPPMLSAIAECDGPFDPLRPHEMLAIGARFGPSNFRLLLRRRVAVGCVSQHALGQALRSWLRRDDAKCRRFRLLRRLFTDVAAAAGGGTSAAGASPGLLRGGDHSERVGDSTAAAKT